MGEAVLDKLGIRPYLTRFVQFFLGFDGVLHGVEVVSAYYEGAWITLFLTLFHSLIFLLAVYFVGHDHSHHIKNNEETHNHGREDSEKDNRIRNIIYVVLGVVLILFLTPIGEWILSESLHLIEHGHEH
jgi:uncharacterized membrane protein